MRAGDGLPPLRIPITRTLVVAGAIASRDYQDVHHDPELARRRGSPDVFMNILTTNGLVGRYVTDCFGPCAVLRKVAIRLGAPNYPGDTMVLTGTVEAVDGNTATVRIVGDNGIGRHVTGTVTLTLPPPDATTDVTAQATADAPPDVTAEATADAPPDVTAEATAEATADAPPDVTAEATADAPPDVTADPADAGAASAAVAREPWTTVTDPVEGAV